MSNLRRHPEVATFELRFKGLDRNYLCRKEGRRFQGKEIGCTVIKSSDTAARLPRFESWLCTLSKFFVFIFLIYKKEITIYLLHRIFVGVELTHVKHLDQYQVYYKSTKVLSEEEV